MKRLATLVAALGLAAGAQAASITYNYGLPIVQGTTEIDQTGLLTLFDPSLGTLTGATLNYFSAGTSTITLANNAAQSQTARAVSSMDILWTSSIAVLDALLTDQQLLFNTGAALSYTSGQSRSFGPLTDAAQTSKNLGSLLASLTGVGTFALNCESVTGITAVGGGGNVRASQATQAGCGAQIIYTYAAAPTPSLPEPGSLALVGLALAVVAAGSRRKA